MSKELEVAIEAAKKAGEISMKYFGRNIQFEKKQDGSPVTAADKECEKAIIETIKASFPHHAFLGEEGGTVGESEFTWIIDPIDGTRNFLRGLPYFGTSIALRKGPKIVLGTMYIPTMQELFTAEKGKGSFLNNEKISVSKIANLEEAVVYFDIAKAFLREETNRQKAWELFRKIYSVMIIGSITMFGDIASGKADGYIDSQPKIWDIAAAKLIIEEAGGKMTDFKGTDTIESGNCVASNGKIHRQIIEELNK